MKMNVLTRPELRDRVGLVLGNNVWLEVERALQAQRDADQLVLDAEIKASAEYIGRLMEQIAALKEFQKMVSAVVGERQKEIESLRVATLESGKQAEIGEINNKSMEVEAAKKAERERILKLSYNDFLKEAKQW